MKELQKWIEPVLKEHGCRLYEIQWLTNQKPPILQIAAEKEDGTMDLDTCAVCSDAISALLDEKDWNDQEYMLEVSSPGLNRKLTRPEHFEAYLGAPVKVKLIRPLEDGRRELSGELVDFTPPGSFEVRLDEETSASFEKKECVSVTVMDDDF